MSPLLSTLEPLDGDDGQLDVAEEEGGVSLVPLVVEEINVFAVDSHRVVGSAASLHLLDGLGVPEAVPLVIADGEGQGPAFGPFRLGSFGIVVVDHRQAP